jgi:predicted nucleic acid-binding protein
LDDYLLDNSAFSPLIAGDAEAEKFARRNRLYIEKTVQTEAEQEHPLLDIEQTITDFGIVEVEPAQAGDIAIITVALGIVVVKPDIQILAAVQKHQLGLVTGDNKLFRRTIRLKYTVLTSRIEKVKFRLFASTMPPWQRILGYQKARRYIRNQFPGLNPHHFTGGR